uniref:Tetratricopeptide repeat domain 1 n=1 Tax=Oncorhynchus kisutch TaxID=8019 RepID=A0A8C7CX97_ONCKI
MDSTAEKESEVLLDKMTNSLTNAMRVSKQHECPDSQSTAAHRGTEQEDDDFFDCEESLDGADGSMSDKERKTDCSEAPLLCQGAEGDSKETVRLNNSQNTEEEHINAELGEAEMSGVRTTILENKEGERGEGMEEEKESWDECTEEDMSLAVEGGDSDTELKGEENPAPEFDEEYLREVEKVLTEEEKESRREESMTLKDKGNSQFKSGEHTEAEESYTAALGVCPVCYSKERAILFSNRAAARLHLRLPQQIHERNEKLKEEMMGKLKDLGNMFLRPFGLSTSNFQVNQDTGTGSYSVNFVQSPNNNNR